MSKTRPAKTGARQRLIETAERLFYAEGIHSVGIDRIIAEAGVAKMTLYNHFASKDDLILAVLQYREEQFGQSLVKSIERHVRKGRNRLDAFFAALKDWFKSSGYRGCSFINASVELADASHPASQFSAAHKVKFHQQIEEIIAETVDPTTAKALAPSIYLLVEGAIVTAVIQQSSDSADVARDAAVALIAAHTKKN